MKHHHYMKYLFVLLLFLPTSLMAQNKEEKMPGHITKIQKLEAVNVTVHILQFLYFCDMSRHILFLVLCHEAGRKEEEKPKLIFQIKMLFHIDDALKRILNDVFI